MISAYPASHSAGEVMSLSASGCLMGRFANRRTYRRFGNPQAVTDRRWGQVQELTHRLHRFGAIAASEQAIVTDAVETLGEDVGEEAADKLADAERHGGVAAGSFDSIVLDLECDASLVERDQTAI